MSDVKSLTSLISLVLVFPLIYLVYSVIGLNFDNFIYLWNNLLLDYSLNTLYLVFLTIFFSLILGIIPAWFISTTKFKGKKFFDIVLFLPLSFSSVLLISFFRHLGLRLRPIWLLRPLFA
jgi:iron(III) transport system permease protein